MKKLIISLILVLALFGCTSSTWKVVADPQVNENKTADIATGSLTSINANVTTKYGATIAEDSYQVNLYLLDAKGNALTSDGKVTVTITDTAKNEVFKKQYNIEKSDFTTVTPSVYSYNKYTQVYTILIPYNQISKAKTYYADVKIDFVDGNGKSYQKTLYSQYLPSYLVESSTTNSYDYGTSQLNPIGVSDIQNSISVKVVKGGISNTYYKDYAIEVEFKNLQNKKIDMSLKDIVLVIGGKQYKPSISVYNTEIGYPVYPNAGVSKTFTFYEAGKTIGSDATIYVTLGYAEPNGASQQTDFTINFKP